VLSSDVFSNVSIEGSVVYEKSIFDYHMCVVKHSTESRSSYYLGYVAVPKSNKFFGKSYEHLDCEEIPIFCTHAEYSESKNHWVIGFDAHTSDFYDTIELVEETYRSLVGG